METVQGVLDRLGSFPEQTDIRKIIDSLVFLAGVDNPNIESALRAAQPTRATWLAGLAYMDGSARRAELALTQAPSDWGDQAVSEIIKRNGSFLVKPDLLEWALPRLTGPDREEVLFKFAMQQARYEMEFPQTSDPDLFQSIRWAAALSDSATRDPLIYGIYQKIRAKTPTQADNILQSPEWPRDIKAVLQRAASEFSPAQPQ